MIQNYFKSLLGIALVSSVAPIVRAADYYVDPSSGSMSNPGTSSQPWSTLQAVFAASKTFSSGDIIYLRDGNHGFPVITDDNTGDVIITRQSGHDPIINRIDFIGATHWVLDNVTVYTSANPPNDPVLVHPVYAQYDNSLVRTNSGSSEITFRDCTIYSIDDASSWSATDWNYDAWNGIYMSTNCHHITIEGCHVRNVNFGIHMVNTTHDIIIRDSIVEFFCGDGVRANCDDLLIENNIIRDCIGSNPGQHYDMIQGFASDGVIIRNNILLNATSSRSLIHDAQGIGAFDGWFDNWVIENNIIATGHWNSLTLLGARNCVVVNNTVVDNPYAVGSMIPWIQIGAHKTAGNSSGNYCRNNLTSDISTMNGTTVSNNIETTSYTSHFVDYSGLDFHLKSGSSAIDAGTTSQAPSTDFEGDTRDSSPDVGADEYGSGGDSEAPSVPTGLTSSNTTATTVDLDWNTSTDNVGVDGYKVYIGGSNPIDVDNVTSVTVTSLTPSTNYTFTVSAYDAASNESSQSSGENVTTASGGGTLISEDFSSGASNFTVINGGTWSVSSGRYVLSSPTQGTVGTMSNLSVHNTSVSGDFILNAVMNIIGTTSAWNDAGIVFGYQDSNNYYYVSLNESNDGNTKGIFKVVSGSPTQLADITISIASDTDYPIEIERSGSSIVAKVNSSQVASTTDSTFTSGKVGFGSFNDGAQFDNLVVTGSGGDTEAPTVPTGLASSNITTTSVDLSWNASTDNIGVTGYKVYTNGSNPVSVTGTSTTISGLTQNTSYTFTVSAVDAAQNESSAGSGVNVTTVDGQAPSVPTGLVSSNITTTTVDLSWNASTDNVGVTGYKVYIDGSNPVSVTGTSTTISGLTQNISYIFTVSAVDAAQNESSQSSGVNVMTASSVLISEDFSSSAANFTVVANGTWNVSSGRYVLTNPQDSGVNGLLGNISVHDTSVSSDFELSAVVNITGTGSAWNDAAVVICYQDTSNYYYVSLNESNDGNTKGVFKVVSGTPTELTDITTSISSDTDYTVEVIRGGSSIVIKLNGNQIASTSDSTFTSGKVGFGTRNDSAQFDDLIVE